MKQIEIKPITYPIRISSSKINLFNECVLKYLFQYWTTLDIKQRIWPGNLMGQSMHRILEDTIKKINDGIPEDEIIRNSRGLFTDKFWFMREETDKNKKQEWRESRAYNEEEFLRKGEKFGGILTKYVMTFLPKKPYQLLSETTIEKPWVLDKEILITGIVDVILRETEELLHIIDLKVTSKEQQYYFVNWEKNIQRIIYHYLCTINFKQQPSTFGFIVLNPQEKVLFHKSSAFINDDKQKYSGVSNIIKQMKQVIIDVHEHGFSTKYKCRNYETCRWCEYKKVCDKIK